MYGSKVIHSFLRRKVPYKNVFIMNPRYSSTNVLKCYQELDIPIHSKQDVVHKAYLDLARKYHPDSGSPEASIEKFCAIENAFRIITKYNAEIQNFNEDEEVINDIKHKAPQHRQYLSFDGVGHGTPFQRMKQWTQSRAQKAAENVMEHRLSKVTASDDTLMKKGQDAKKHDIKTKYGFDRLVEDLIQESISRGEFENLSGKGKPLQNQSINPYVDFTTHKLNEVLINNGFTPEWIIMNKDINQEIEAMIEKLKTERSNFGPYPLTEEESIEWKKVSQTYSNLVNIINSKIDTFNLIVPLLNKQRFHIKLDKICEEVLVSGITSANKKNPIKIQIQKVTANHNNMENDILILFFRAMGDVFAEVLKMFSKDKNIRNRK